MICVFLENPIYNIVVTGTPGIRNAMGSVETHCEELFPRIADYRSSIIAMI